MQPPRLFVSDENFVESGLPETSGKGIAWYCWQVFATESSNEPVRKMARKLGEIRIHLTVLMMGN